MNHSYERALESFRHMGADTDRPNAIIKLIREGIWRELDGTLPPGTTLREVTRAAIDNGYDSAHPGSITSSYECSSKWARATYIKRTSPISQNLIALDPPVHMTTYQLYQLNHWLVALESSSLPPTAKHQYRLAALIYRHTGDPKVVLSQRATVEATDVNKKRVTRNWVAGEKQGLSSVDKGVSFDDIDGDDKTKSRSAEITLNIDVFPMTPIECPVDLDALAPALNKVKGYIKFRRLEKRSETHQWLKKENISTARPPEPISAPIPCAPRPGRLRARKLPPDGRRAVKIWLPHSGDWECYTTPRQLSQEHPTYPDEESIPLVLAPEARQKYILEFV